jgi:hypothetical protein
LSSGISPSCPSRFSARPSVSWRGSLPGSLWTWSDSINGVMRNVNSRRQNSPQPGSARAAPSPLTGCQLPGWLRFSAVPPGSKVFVRCHNFSDGLVDIPREFMALVRGITFRLRVHQASGPAKCGVWAVGSRENPQAKRPHTSCQRSCPSPRHQPLRKVRTAWFWALVVSCAKISHSVGVMN